MASACKVRCRVLVRRAGAGDSELARAALAEVIQGSWEPVHALVRRGGFRGPDADDLTQTYFARFLEKGYIRTAASWKGCLRPFLRTTVRNFLSNQRDHDRAAKRGGRRWPVSIEELAEKGRVLPELQHRVTPETLLERRQVEVTLVRAVRKLAEEHRAAGRGERFARLRACLLDEHTTDTHAALAAEWGVGESAVRVALHRLRRRLAEILREGAGRPDAPSLPQVVLPTRLPPSRQTTDSPFDLGARLAGGGALPLRGTHRSERAGTHFVGGI